MEISGRAEDSPDGRIHRAGGFTGREDSKGALLRFRQDRGELKCLGTELNRRRRPFQGRALPTELPRLENLIKLTEEARARKDRNWGPRITRMAWSFPRLAEVNPSKSQFRTVPHRLPI